MLARVRALLRRHSLIDGPAVIVCGPLEIDTAARIATFDGVPVELRRQEFALLAHLARDPARVHEKQDLLHAVWGYRATGSTRTVDSHASRLRRKLASAGRRRLGVLDLRRRLPPRARHSDSRIADGRRVTTPGRKESLDMSTDRSREQESAAALAAFGQAVRQSRERAG
ncbi:MAG: response regulator transcription factor [Solirubrobacteraceae bacterium]